MVNQQNLNIAVKKTSDYLNRYPNPKKTKTYKKKKSAKLYDISAICFVTFCIILVLAIVIAWIPILFV